MPTPLPWVYPYLPEREVRRGQTPLRPVVPVSLVAQTSVPAQFALVDSGAEHTLAASWLADEIGIDIAATDDHLELGIGGQVVEAHFVEVTLLLRPSIGATDFIEWRTDVGFIPGWRPLFSIILGQIGFFDRFTVTMHRGAAALAVEAWEAFDERFGV